MAMNFWESQRKAKSKTALYLAIFIVLTVCTSTLAELAMRTFAWDTYGNPEIPYVGLAFLAIIFIVALFNYANYLQSGGSYVAESMGGYLVDPDSNHPKERQLINIVEELAISTGLPIPPIYIIDANEINAFAAGTSPENAAIGVTRGTLLLLTRDELQGVLAHEFGHIYHRDMKIGMRVAAMIAGFFIISLLGLRILQFTPSQRSSNEEGGSRGGNPLVLVAFIFMIAGALMWFFGSMLQAMVSRQREYLADASSVQFTRNPLAIANALRKIAASDRSDMPRSGTPYAHLYFNEHDNFWSRLFATHPPIEERIAAIEGGVYEKLPPPPPGGIA